MQVSLFLSHMSLMRPGTPAGLLHATAKIYHDSGIRGLFQGHSATLLRIFPYAGIKFLFYDWIEKVRTLIVDLADVVQRLIPTPDKATPGRFFLAGASSGEWRMLWSTPDY